MIELDAKLAATACQNSVAECEIVTDFRRLAELSSDWQRLADQDSGADIFQHWDWARAFWKAYGGGVALYSPVVRRNASVIGILPLVRRGKVIEFLSAPLSDYNDLLCEEENSVAVLHAALSSLLQAPDEWDTCVLENVPSDSRISRHMEALPLRLQRHLQRIFLQPAPTVVLKENRPEILTQLSNKDQLKRYHRKLQKLGRVTFRHLETREEAREHLGAFFDQIATRAAMSGLQSDFLQPQARAFCEALIAVLDPRTELRFGVLELDSVPVAYHFGFQVNGKLTWYKPAFDIDYWEYCPGDVLLRNLFQYARRADVQEFDFSVGDEPYKYRFSNHVKQNYAVFVERHPTRLTSRLHTLLRSGQNAIRSRPAAKRVSKNIIEKLQHYISNVSLPASGRLPELCGGALATFFQQTVYKLSEVVVLSCRAREAGHNGGAAVIPGTLKQLAHIALDYPELLNAKVLRNYRLRLRQGDKAFISFGDEGGVLVFWLCRRAEISVPEIRPDLRIPLAVPALVITDKLSTPRFPVGSIPEVFRALLDHCGSEEEVWISCLQGESDLLGALQHAGFQPRYRLQHRALLHFFGRTHAVSIPQTDEARKKQDSTSCQSVNPSNQN